MAAARRSIRRVLRALPVADTVRVLPRHRRAAARGAGRQAVSRQQPIARRARRAAARARARRRRAAHRPPRARRRARRRRLSGRDDARARSPRARVVLATGGLSLPKTGSDGWGIRHRAALRPHHRPDRRRRWRRWCSDDARPRAISRRAVGRRAAGVSWTCASTAAVAARVAGSLLWTHFGISGPAALDLSRHWLRAAARGPPRGDSGELRAPASTFDSLERAWLTRAARAPRTGVADGARRRRCPRRWRPQCCSARHCPATPALAAAHARRHGAPLVARRCSSGRSPSATRAATTTPR